MEVDSKKQNKRITSGLKRKIIIIGSMIAILAGARQYGIQNLREKELKKLDLDSQQQVLLLKESGASSKEIDVMINKLNIIHQDMDSIRIQIFEKEKYDDAASRINKFEKDVKELEKSGMSTKDFKKWIEIMRIWVERGKAGKIVKSYEIEDS